ncbi:MAG TPA: zinc-ribbon and DUF3426 domain-containing protein [Gallionellaceae bacterium]|nr:zinc-ribbon and DUF3426 domain-containing protein [Gallionellaceae bacterium]
MSTTTQCPACGTRFKASQAQLEAYHGMVRCGHCQAAFNAIENRSSGDPSPQLDLPIVLEDLSPPQIETRTEATEIDFPAESLDDDYASNTYDHPEPASTPRTWPWAVASLLLFALLLAQAMYFFRVEIAALLPSLKPTLVAACGKLHCNIPLPHNADLMSIESSDLETDPAQPGVITLSVTLRNHASYAQDYPNLELTLTDINDVPVGRRIFRSGEYLKDAEDDKSGLAGNRENTIRLAIDASGIKAVGYRLFLSY